MQKIINVLAVASFALSGAIAVSGVYVYVNRDSIIDGVKQKVIGNLGGLGGSLGGDLPIGTPDLAPSAPADAASIPSGGLGIPTF